MIDPNPMDPERLAALLDRIYRHEAAKARANQRANAARYVEATRAHLQLRLVKSDTPRVPVYHARAGAIHEAEEHTATAAAIEISEAIDAAHPRIFDALALAISVHRPRHPERSLWISRNAEAVADDIRLRRGDSWDLWRREGMRALFSYRLFVDGVRMWGAARVDFERIYTAVESGVRALADSGSRGAAPVKASGTTRARRGWPPS